MHDLPKLNGALDQRTVFTMSQPPPQRSRLSLATARVAIAAFLLLLTVPWWPNLDGQIGGVPSWAVFSLVASVVYAFIVAWLLERYWDDGEGEETSDTRHNAR